MSWHDKSHIYAHVYIYWLTCYHQEYGRVLECDIFILRDDLVPYRRWASLTLNLKILFGLNVLLLSKNPLLFVMKTKGKEETFVFVLRLCKWLLPYLFKGKLLLYTISWKLFTKEHTFDYLDTFLLSCPLDFPILPLTKPHTHG